jgi:tetratricopeptide (TPR) repeat protein
MSVFASPYIPAHDDDIVADLPTATSPDARRAMMLHKLLARAPDSLELALQTAAKDMDVARAQSDPRFAGYAEAALSPWWSLPDPPVQVLMLRATIRQNRHDFEGALADLAMVLKERPQDGQAYLTRAVVRQVRGDFAGAADDCASLAKLTTGLAARACADSVGSVSGRAAESFTDLATANDKIGANGDKGVESWCLALLAEMAERQGKPNLAEGYFKRALALGYKDGYLMGAYADFLLDQRRPAEVVALLEEQTRIDPLLLRLALAEQQLNMPSLAVHVADLGQRFATARVRGDRVHQREEARYQLFLAKNPAEAMRLALANWTVQREPADVQVFLQAALAADPTAAEPVLDWIRDNHFEDVDTDALVRQLGKGRS